MSMQDPRFPVKVQVTFAGRYGAVLIATLINTFIYGVALIMSMRYFKLHAKKDLRVLKITVFVLTLLATLEVVFTGYELYDTFIIKSGNPDLLDEIVLSVPGKFACAYLTVFVAQMSVLLEPNLVCQSLGSRLRFFIIPVLLLALLQIRVALILATSGTYSKLSSRTGLLVPLTTIQGVVAAVCDILITIALCCVFHSHRSGLKRTDSLVNRLIIYAINRAIATSVCALFTPFLYYFFSGTRYFTSLVPMLANTHLYVISAVSILTSREGLRQEVNQAINFSDMGMNNTTSDVVNAKNRRPIIPSDRTKFPLILRLSPQRIPCSISREQPSRAGCSSRNAA
ncbi:hypothetical protein M422DRAFT_262338 [Sphaerobolus stellatus SS14]|uniref:DUF6534 domain-containing protein n=1 Tax=Sphaerobolus stellatus (strain SS14) TaxID=990650 RepID=A0A0C9TY20_SPHS4|nr:hypothetical protein M422DRAFT_262338 [Sphaerobolus stellatus SS14]